MSLNSPFKKDYSEYEKQESSNLLTTSEHLSDSNILKSRKSYGKKRDDKNLSISCENSDYLSATVSKHLENDTLFPSSSTKELYGKEIFESDTSVGRSYSEDTDVQKDSNVNSEFCLFNDEDTDYYLSNSTEVQKDPHSLPSIPEASYSSSYYQRTRKNLKSRLSNQECSFEEMSESRSQEENSDSPNKFKSVSNFLNLAEVPSTAKNSHVSADDEVEHTRNGTKSTDACVNKLPQKPIVFQMGNQAGKTSAGKTSDEGTLLQNSSKNSSNMFSMVDLVYRFSASNNQALSKSNPAIKQKRIQRRREFVSTKKTVVKHDVSSKVNFDEKKMFNSTNSVRSKSISDIGKRDVKSPSKAVKKWNDESIKSTERSMQMLEISVSKNETVKKYSTKGKCPSTSYLQMFGNETAEKIQSDNGDKQIEKTLFVESQECINEKQAFNNIPEKDVASNFALNMPMIIAPNPSISQEGSQMAPLCIWSAVPSINNSIQVDNQALLHKNFNDLSVPGPSTLNNNYSSLNAEDFNVKNLHSDMSISYLHKDITTTTTTIITENNSQPVFRPQNLINSGINFQQCMDKTFKEVEDNCILKCKEEATETFLKNPSLLNLTVKTFCQSTSVTDALLDCTDRLEMDESFDVHNSNKGYDFPENFENENLMRVVKDFMHTAASYLIPADAKKPITLTYSQIITAAKHNMSTREFVALVHVFRKPEPIYQLKDVMSRLSIVALFVIFNEYEEKVKRR